ncbi:MAG TPA: DUF2249 domain-containing protein [Gemmatimonadales bacterium]|nr:DUF2249 domain-containing protein [Gemmatimonadales bacterium]
MNTTTREEQETDMTVKSVLDVRAIAPRERHPLILGTFADLAPGEAFVLVNDHDPKPLYYQFQFEKAGQFTWTYQAEGPEVWRVEIGRIAAGAAH